MQRITPDIWCNGTADEARDFYLEAFAGLDASLVQQNTYPTEGLLDFQRHLAGQTLTNEISIGGFHLILVNAGDEFQPNPSINFFVNFDPAAMDQPREKLDVLWERLTDGGRVLMALGEYDYSPHYGWVEDRYGVSWQLMLTNPEGDPRPLIIPQLMFCGDAQGRAEEAIAVYTGVFADARVGNVVKYPHNDEVVFSDFQLMGEWFAAMDSGVPQDFTFTEGVSLMVQVDGQEEIDRLWASLAEQEQPCGWCKDRFGVSWQIVPANLGELMQNPGSYEKLMGMSRIVVDEF